MRGMLPKNSLGRSMIKKLHVVPGAEHPHQAQQPVPYTLGQPPVWEGLPEQAAPAHAQEQGDDRADTRQAGREEARRQAEDDGQERREVAGQEVGGEEARRQEAHGAQDHGVLRPEDHREEDHCQEDDRSQVHRPEDHTKKNEEES